eukprot:8543131-Pyramimonas_sp.AAC.1
MESVEFTVIGGEFTVTGKQNVFDAVSGVSMQAPKCATVMVALLTRQNVGKQYDMACNTLTRSEARALTIAASSQWRRCLTNVTRCDGSCVTFLCPDCRRRLRIIGGKFEISCGRVALQGLKRPVVTWRPISGLLVRGFSALPASDWSIVRICSRFLWARRVAMFRENSAQHFMGVDGTGGDYDARDIWR